MTEMELRARGLWGLSKSETRVAQLVANGYTTAEAGRILWVSPETIKFHLVQLYRKLDVRNRVEFARAWIVEVEVPCGLHVAEPALRTAA